MGFFNNILSFFMTSPSPEQEKTILSRISEFDNSLAQLSRAYTYKPDAEAFIRKWRDVAQEIKSIFVPRNHACYNQIHHLLNNIENLSSIIASYNARFIEEEKRRCDALLSSIDGKSLDDQQRTVVVTDEARNLVIAGAGSGKTLTIAGKVKYLCDVKGIAPEDILLIAFTRKAADEMSERICGKLNLPVQATTFHKLGLDIISEANGKRPDVDDGLFDFVLNYFENDIINDSKAVRNIIEFFAYYLNMPADLEKCGSLGEAYEAEKGADLETLRSKYEQQRFLDDTAQERKSDRRTLQNEQVKSLEEVSIANFLFLHGVNYEYERLYPYKSDDPMRKPYRPDFYLPDYDIYIEHFGINRNGRVPWLPPVEEEKYIEDMRWKQDFHKKNGTVLLETYSYYSSEGRLTDELEKVLKAHNVQFKEPDYKDIFDKVYTSKGEKYFSEFIRLCCTFITLFKSGAKDPSQIRSLRSSNPAYHRNFFLIRTALFLELIAPILQAYDADLAKRDAIDFSDMINKAATLVSGGFQVHAYKWLIIDEYQDISVARYQLIKAILNQTGAKLLCVGDDWQSIYRFAGSDVGLFTRFDHYFESPVIMRLEQTYRNSQQLIDEAGAFVMKNPQQYRKHLTSSKRLDYPITFLHYDDSPFSVLQRAINKIIHGFGPESSILILGRTNFDMEILQKSNLFQVRNSVRDSGKLTYKPSPSTPIFFMTVHRSKGLEADNVILLNFENSTLGFPNKIADDPLLELVLEDGENYPYAEERRLLYVALTRTKNRIFILVDENKPSEFMKEFHASPSVFIMRNNAGSEEESVRCPKCKTGHLTIRKNSNNHHLFVGCSNFPQCDFTVRDTSVLTNPRYCPMCGGFLVKRKGQWGTFYGCTNYPFCRYTEKTGQGKDRYTMPPL